METMESPYKFAKDSPSRQLLWELSQLAISTQEKFNDRLDRACKEREAAHSSALAASIAEHERVRRDAEIERQRIELQIQEEQRRREEEKRRELEQIRQLAERKETERAQAAERAEREATAERKAREAEATRQKAAKAQAEADAAKRLKEEEEQEERAKQLDEQKRAQAAEADRVAEEKRASAEKTRNQEARFVTSKQAALQSTQPPPRSPEREAESQRYQEIHKKLKELRKYMADQAKQIPGLKQKMGDMRREIKKSVGQFTEDKTANKVPHAKILSVLKEAVTSFPQPTTSLAMFIARPVQDAQAPALVIFLLNHFAKAVISQYINEASVSPKLADPIGTVTSSIFALEDLKCNGVSLIDVLIAKFHVVCPPLFGIYGDEKTTEGRTRLGWWREGSDGPWISDQRHWDRMAGLGAGFASIALRNFEKSRSENPYPPYHYWQSLSSILNIPAGHVTETHFIIVRSMLLNSESRFMLFFGKPAFSALRFAILEFPKKAAQQTPAASSLAGLEHTFRKDKGICF
ncbi:MAG: hypothetical protein LQ342_004358 [Letrouitia transgressa]|nr:MAG: hypothetical protein LQ342_004358 [Letrouitia transgressa]